MKTAGIRKKYIGFIVLIILWGGLLRLPYCFHTVLSDPDEAWHAANAVTLLDGGLIYADAVADNKPPGIYAVYYVLFLLFGRYNMAAVHAATFLCALATAAVLGALAYRIKGWAAALLTSLFYMTFTAALIDAGVLEANTEIFMVFPYALAALLLWLAVTAEKGGLYLLSGTAAGLTPLFKQVGGVELAAVLAYLLLLPVLGGRKWGASLKACAWFGAGFLLPAAVTAWLFHQRGILSDAIFWTIVYPGRYIGQSASNLSFLTQFQENFLLFVFSMPLVWILCALWVRRAAARADSPEKAPHAFHVFLILWLVASVLATWVGKRMYSHYFIQILPPLVLTAAFGAARYFSDGGGLRARLWRKAVFLVTLLTGIAFVCVNSLLDDPLTPHPDFRAATEYVQTHTRPDDRIFVWGNFPPVYVYSRRTPATRFVATQMLTGYVPGNDPDEKRRGDYIWVQTPEAWPMLEADLRRNRPRLILDTAPGNYNNARRYPLANYPVLRRYVDENCRLETTVAGMDVYRCGE